jgi:PAS domain S-box-containing protein
MIYLAYYIDFTYRDNLAKELKLSNRKIQKKTQVKSTRISIWRVHMDSNEKLVSLLEGILNASPDIIFAKDSSFTYISCNKAFAELTNKPINKIIGAKDEDLFDDGQLVQGFRVADKQIIASQKNARIEEWVTYPDGRKVLLDTLKAPFYDDDGKLIGLLGVCRDVTARVEVESNLRVAKEKAERVIVAKSDFLAKMSHSIRTPMNAVIGLSRLTLQTHLNNEQEDYLEKILSSTETLLGLINDILDFSKIETDKLSIEKHLFELNNIVAKTINISAMNAHTKELELNTHVSPHTRLPSKREEEIIPNFSQAKILLVDDNAINRQVAQGFLKDTHAQVDIAENGLIALEKIKSQPYDLVLMDIQMPKMDGLTATKIIKSELNLSTLPIIAITAHAMSEDVGKSIQAGMCEHLSKPISPEQLYQCLTKYLIDPPMALTSKKLNSHCLCDYANKSDDDKLLAKLANIQALTPEQALRKMGGRTKLYLNLVHDFYKSQHKTVTELSQVSEDSQWEPLYRLIHTLKSNAAYIGAYDIVRLCNAFELSLEKNTYSLSMLNSIIESLITLLDQLKYLFVPTKQKTNKVHFSKTAFVDMLQLILPKLQQSDFSAEELLPDLALLVTSSSYYLRIEKLITLIDDVEYEQAIEVVEDLLIEIRA